jgi:hypothetical protein
MVSADENMPIRESGRNGKADKKAEKAEQQAKKTAKRNRKPAQAAVTPDQVLEAPVPVESMSAEAPVESIPAEAPVESMSAEAQVESMPMEVPAESMESPPAETASDASAIAPAEAAPVSLQTITNAYGDYTRRSIEQTSSFIEQLAGTRSLSRALELQSEFARQTYETFVAEARKIRELHSEMTVQRLRSLEGLVARRTPTRST